MRGRVLIFELHRVFEPKRGSISKCTTLLLIRRFAPPSPQGEGFWRTFPHCCIQIYIAVPRGRGRTPPLRLDWQHGQNPHQRAGQDNIKRGMLKRASLFWYRRREYSGGAAASVPPGFSFGTASAARTACRGAKSGRSNDGFSQHHGIKKRGALVSVPLSGTGDGNRTRMAQCRGILSPLCLPVPPRRRTCVFYHPAPPASRGALRKRPPSVLDGGLIFKLLRR